METIVTIMDVTVTWQGVPLGHVDRLTGGTIASGMLRLEASLAPDWNPDVLDGVILIDGMIPPEVCESMDVLDDVGARLPARVLQFAIAGRSGAQEATL